MREITAKDIGSGATDREFARMLDSAKKALSNPTTRQHLSIVLKEDLRDYELRDRVLGLVGNRNTGTIRILYLLLGAPDSWKKVDGNWDYMKSEVVKEFSGRPTYPPLDLSEPTNPTNHNLPDYTKELQMSQTQPSFFEVKQFVNGKDIATMSNHEIYNAIQSMETYIKNLETIENKPKALVKELEEARAEIKALVEFMDSKEVK